jgi:hypothetical protein
MSLTPPETKQDNIKYYVIAFDIAWIENYRTTYECHYKKYVFTQICLKVALALEIRKEEM